VGVQTQLSHCIAANEKWTGCHIITKKNLRSHKSLTLPSEISIIKSINPTTNSLSIIWIHNSSLNNTKSDMKKATKAFRSSVDNLSSLIPKSKRQKSSHSHQVSELVENQAVPDPGQGQEDRSRTIPQEEIPVFASEGSSRPPEIGNRALKELRSALAQFSENYQRFADKHRQFVRVQEGVELAFIQAENINDMANAAQVFRSEINKTMEILNEKEHSRKSWPRKLGEFLASIYPVLRLSLCLASAIAEVFPLAMLIHLKGAGFFPLKGVADGLGIILQVRSEISYFNSCSKRL